MSKRKSKKTITIKLNLKKIWELPRGHQEHLSGAGVHDSRPKRRRGRNDANRKSIRDSEDCYS